ncbi:Regulator of chromosome condensation RCC1 [Penicillium angulare]|uniref:Regulator of chromosome condensation RCC1 n=1 Tax=Penicillium angulare TaxID=116970 RepID=UPI00254242D0|nr:Regulator of chromosome condensation RCC1 [Penicillium angulare]KAJ5273116.1 Regulator of chromosome condensation RCC1 [Penicillium angulare]
MNLLAFGSNGSGQLGLGHEEDVSTPTKCLFTHPTEQKQDDKIIQIVAGGNHTLILTETGTVYASGCNTDSRCGIPSPAAQELNDQEPRAETQAGTQDYNSNININTFQRVVLIDHETGTTVKKFKCIAATWEGSLLVSEIELNDGTAQDRVFVHGSSAKGELGVERSTLQPGTSIPNFPPSNTSIRSIKSSMNHTVTVLCNGTVYGWGASRKGQLGENLKAGKIIYTPSQIDVPFHATNAVSGREFTVIVGDKEKGEIIVFGDQFNRWGICDVRDGEGLRERVRTRIREWDSEIQVEESELDRDQDREQRKEKEKEKGGDGDGARASVGLSSHASTSATSPTGSTSMSQSWCQWGFGFEDIGASWHGIYVLVRTRGHGHGHGRFVNPNSDKHDEKDEDGNGNGIIVSWGRNDRGQLPDAALPSVHKLAVGSEHALVLLGDGSVAAFGWGEHGNCGPDTDNRGNVSGYKVISLPDTSAKVRGSGRVVGVGAGCATSWVILD